MEAPSCVSTWRAARHKNGFPLMHCLAITLANGAVSGRRRIGDVTPPLTSWAELASQHSTLAVWNGNLFGLIWRCKHQSKRMTESEIVLISDHAEMKNTWTFNKKSKNVDIGTLASGRHEYPYSAERDIIFCWNTIRTQTMNIKLGTGISGHWLVVIGNSRRWRRLSTSTYEYEQYVLNSRVVFTVRW